jgi:hypothetical protein
VPGPVLTNPLYSTGEPGHCSGIDREFKFRRPGGRTYIHTLRTVPAKEKPGIWFELPKRFAVLHNLLVLNRKLQYPALAANPSTGVLT